jgi:uncharacterized protein YjbI with pentapeptide repeats
MTMTGTEHNQPTVAELVARIEELEERLVRRRGLRRVLPGRVGIMAGLVLTLVFGPTFASLAGAASPTTSFWSLTGNSLTTGQFLGTTNTEPLVLKTNSITAMTIAPGSGTTPGDVAVAGTLNAAGGLQENGTDLSSKYALVGGTNATGTWPIGITGNAGTVSHGIYSTGSYSDPPWLTALAGSKIIGPVASATMAGTATNFSGSLAGDVTGTQGSTTVTGINGSPLGTTTGATSGQVLKWDGAHWAPGTDNTGLTSVSTDGTLTGNGTGGTPLAVNKSAIQTRVTGTCSSASTISAVNADGTVSCQTPPPVLCPGCYLPHAQLHGADLVRAQLGPDRAAVPTTLAFADLSGADLNSAILTNANLEGASLAFADLSFANLSTAFLPVAILTNATLNGADLTGANLDTANLNGATGGASATITGVIWNNTTCPDGTNSDTNGTSPHSCIGHGF